MVDFSKRLTWKSQFLHGKGDGVCKFQPLLLFMIVIFNIDANVA